MIDAIVNLYCIANRFNPMVFVTISVHMFMLMIDTRFEMLVPMIVLNYMRMNMVAMFMMSMSMMLSMSKCW